jgi:hypothetical protein
MFVSMNTCMLGLPFDMSQTAKLAGRSPLDGGLGNGFMAWARG